ncbi:efflux RND transporter permease subunit [Singulisphaera sp. PoT]|uniref:efflux RND transporter permease subunit n=1 Tax=Singulisphaera sp. PoT TaxID=3411797 RepID=UPI003BF57581
MVNFFIGRQIFATVLALLMLLVGGICAFVLLISLYPEIVPPQVQVTTTYTGADAQSVADTVTTPVEQQINGVKGPIYFSSDSTSNGVTNIIATFAFSFLFSAFNSLTSTPASPGSSSAPSSARRSSRRSAALSPTDPLEPSP